MIQIQSSGLDWVKQIGERFAQHLLRQSKFVRYKYQEKPINTEFGELYRFILITIEEKKYAIDFNDTDISQLDNSNVTKILKCQYNPSKTYQKSIPYTYFPKDLNLLQNMLKELRMTKRVLPFYFRGKLRDKREETIEILRHQFNFSEGKIGIQEYYRECATAKICLSLPGHGNFCHREIECFGMGVPVLMPKLINRSYNELIPDKHYICVEYDASKIIERCSNITTEELQNISANAMAWYEDNVKNCVQLAFSLLAN